MMNNIDIFQEGIVWQISWIILTGVETSALMRYM